MLYNKFSESSEMNAASTSSNSFQSKKFSNSLFKGDPTAISNSYNNNNNQLSKKNLNNINTGNFPQRKPLTVRFFNINFYKKN